MRNIILREIVCAEESTKSRVRLETTAFPDHSGVTARKSGTRCTALQPAGRSVGIRKLSGQTSAKCAAQGRKSERSVAEDAAGSLRPAAPCRDCVLQSDTYFVRDWYDANGGLKPKHNTSRGYPCKYEGSGETLYLSHVFKTDVIKLTFFISIRYLWQPQKTRRF